MGDSRKIKEARIRPPRVAERLLRLLLNREERLHRLGDFEEVFQTLIESEGRFRAWRWYWWQVMRSIPVLIHDSLYHGAVMFHNYLKIALRHIKRHKGYAFINIAGLAVGMASCILILIWVQDELSFDTFHKNADDIGRIIVHDQTAEGIQSAALSPPPLAEYLISGYPEIVNATRFRIHNNWLMQSENKKFMEDGLAFVEPSFFEMFTFPIKGDPETALLYPNSLIITQSMAEKYFGEEDPIGKNIRANNRLDFVVTGVIQDIPENSHLSFQFAAPFSLLPELYDWDLSRWTDVMYRTYVQLREGASFNRVSSKIADILKEKCDNDRFTLDLQPLTDIHLRSTHLQFDAVAHGDIRHVHLFSILALLILVMACINFISLTTARGGHRAKEVGLRKTSGANRRDIVKQFLEESILVTTMALFIAVGLVMLLLPAFNALSGKHLTMHMLMDVSFLTLMIGIVVITGLFAGGYPALFFSAFQPVKVLKGIRERNGKGSSLRTILVIVQFTASILLIVSLMVVYKQLAFIQNMKLGYDKEHMIYLPARGDIQSNYEAAKREWLRHPGIVNVTVCSSLPTQPGHHWGGLDWPGKDPSYKPAMWFYSVDFDFIRTFDIPLAAGRDFSKEIPTDEQNYIINESAARFMGLSEPVGQWFSRSGKKGTIIGVVKDFHFESARKKVEPLVIKISSFYQYIFFKIRPGRVPETLNYIGTVWKAFNPEFPMEHHFLDEAFDRIYRAEYRMGRIFRYFTGLAIFISALGLFGLASFTAQERTKEIGVRKVLGASIPLIVYLITKDFFKWVLMANIIAWPLAWMAMSRWLQNFAYRVDIGMEAFVLSACFSMVIAWLAIGYQSIKAATTNPVKALRYE